MAETCCLTDYLAMKQDFTPATEVQGDLLLDDYERLLIEEAFARYNGKVAQMAKALGLSRATVYRKLAHYDLFSR